MRRRRRIVHSEWVTTGMLQLAPISERKEALLPFAGDRAGRGEGRSCITLEVYISQIIPLSRVGLSATEQLIDCSA